MHKYTSPSFLRSRSLPMTFGCLFVMLAIVLLSIFCSAATLYGFLKEIAELSALSHERGTALPSSYPFNLLPPSVHSSYDSLPWLSYLGSYRRVSLVPYIQRTATSGKSLRDRRLRLISPTLSRVGVPSPFAVCRVTLLWTRFCS